MELCKINPLTLRKANLHLLFRTKKIPPEIVDKIIDCFVDPPLTLQRELELCAQFTSIPVNVCPTLTDLLPNNWRLLEYLAYTAIAFQENDLNVGHYKISFMAENEEIIVKLPKCRFWICGDEIRRDMPMVQIDPERLIAFKHQVDDFRHRRGLVEDWGMGMFGDQDEHLWVCVYHWDHKSDPLDGFYLPDDLSETDGSEDFAYETSGSDDSVLIQ